VRGMAPPSPARRKKSGKGAATPSPKPKRASIKASTTAAPAASAGGGVPASEAVRHEWARRVEAEYRSAAITQHLTLWLIQLGASPDLIDAGLRIVKDELVHAELSHETFVAAGGKALSPIERETLEIRHDPEAPLELRVVRTCVETFCLGETVAVPLFKNLREECTVPTAKRALDRVLKDEVRHRDFGWSLLGYLLEQPYGPELEEAVRVELPRFLARVHHSYAPPGSEARTAISAADRAWGLMPVARYAEVLERTVSRDYAPRFDRLGIDVHAAWTEATER
jgi:hypothetical protein